MFFFACLLRGQDDYVTKAAKEQRRDFDGDGPDFGGGDVAGMLAV